MQTIKKPITITTFGVLSFCIGVWLRLEADAFSTISNPYVGAPYQNHDQYSALVVIAYTLVGLGAALFVLAAVAFLFFAEFRGRRSSTSASSDDLSIANEPVA